MLCIRYSLTLDIEYLGHLIIFSYLDSISTIPNVGDLMDTNRNSVESQLRTRCNILESQVETLKKQKSNSPEKFIAKDGAQAEQWKEVSGIGRFPA